VKCPSVGCERWLQFTPDALGRTVERCDCGHRRVLDARAMVLRAAWRAKDGRLCVAYRGPLPLGTLEERQACVDPEHRAAAALARAWRANGRCVRCGEPIPRTGSRAALVHERCLTPDELRIRLAQREYTRTWLRQKAQARVA
jgi:hypothetical protein